MRAFVFLLSLLAASATAAPMGYNMPRDANDYKTVLRSDVPNFSRPFSEFNPPSHVRPEPAPAPAADQSDTHKTGVIANKGWTTAGFAAGVAGFTGTGLLAAGAVNNAKNKSRRAFDEYEDVYGKRYDVQLFDSPEARSVYNEVEARALERPAARAQGLRPMPEADAHKWKRIGAYTGVGGGAPVALAGRGIGVNALETSRRSLHEEIPDILMLPRAGRLATQPDVNKWGRYAGYATMFGATGAVGAGIAGGVNAYEASRPKQPGT